MKKYALFVCLIALILLNYNNSYAQLSEGGEPISFSFKSSDLSSLSPEILPSFDIDALIAEDEIVDKIGGIPWRFGHNHDDLNLNPENSGVIDFLPDGSKIWRLSVKSENALSINLTFDRYLLPEGAKLFIYNKSKTHVIGAFTHHNNQDHGQFATTLIQGDEVIIEYFEPSTVSFPGDLNLWRATHAYRGPYDFAKAFGSSGACNKNVACPESAGWENEINSVAIMVTGGSGFCTGTVVNNTANDGKPYFLTADHCYSNPANWIFWFNWQSATCNNPPTAPGYNSINGATLRARNAASDFCLVEINSMIPEEFGAYWSGWNRTLDANIAGYIAGIHHPNGDIKKFSWSDNGVTATAYGGNPGTTHWRITWSGQTTTEPGSSGSGLWDSNHHLIGQLHGGGAACGNTQPDWYGRFGVSWTGGGTNATRLSNWLDPGNTGVQTLDGFDFYGTSTGNAPVAEFSGAPTTVVVGGQVSFTDLSTNNPTAWQWTFQNGTPPTANTPNPNVTYNTPGIWNVTLTASNAHGDNTMTKNQYITVVQEGELAANFIGNPTTVPVGGTVQFTDQSSGPPTSWSWEFAGGNPPTSPDQNPSVTYPAAGVYSVTLTVSDGTNTEEFIRNNYINVTPPGGGDLVAGFVASAYNITAGSCINFNDQSQGGPTTWSWSFPGASPLTSTSQNPTNICYNAPGIYDVCLMVTRGGDTDTYCCSGCIIVTPDPTLPIADFSANQTTIPVGGVVHFTNLSQNGPFQEWAWTFQGGIPFQTNLETPTPIAYFQVGEFDVELRCKNTNGVQDLELKQNYIKVIPQATQAPTANFEANYTFIQPGESVNFIDYSTGNPYIWNWEFTGGNPPTSMMQNPTDITYANPGLYPVKLTVSNNFGADELVKEQYILVSDEDTCTQAPIVKFTADTRLIPAGRSIGFINQSLNNPTTFNWSFPGGSPNFSQEASPTTKIKYNNPGIYSVTLAASNACGGDILTKNQYIYVFSGNVAEYCDTLTNIGANEVFEPRTNQQIGWGFLAGQNGDIIRAYADKFENHTYSHIKGLLVPVSYSVYKTYNSFVTFTIWDGNTEKPEIVLGQKKVLLRDITPNQTNVVMFDNPVEIDGPFYVGYVINYIDPGDQVGNDLFAVGIATPRGNNPANNTLYVRRSANQWFSANERYGFSSSLPIRPLSCLVDIDEFLDDLNVSVYPNPSTGIVNIALGEIDGSRVEIEVFDLLGRKFDADVQNAYYGEYTIDLSGKPEGMYILRVKTGKYVINKKLLLSK